MVHKNNLRFTTEMKSENQSSVVDVIFLGFSNFPQLQGQLFGVFLVDYLVTLLGNAIIIVVISLKQSFHVPMYLFLLNLSLVEVGFNAVIMPEMLVVLSSEKNYYHFCRLFFTDVFHSSFWGD